MSHLHVVMNGRLVYLKHDGLTLAVNGGWLGLSHVEMVLA
jgi:hypothetical protein